MKSKNILISFALLIGASTALHAAAGTEAASFLNIPVGAEPAALGGAFSALANNAYAPVWNPGGLGRVETAEIAAQHLNYLESVHYEFASVVYPLSKGRTIGASVQYLGTGDIESTDEGGNSIGSISNRYGAYSFSYGQPVGEKLSLGLTGKIIDARLADVGASAYAVDAGAMYQYSSRLTLAGVVANVGSQMKFINQSDSLPLAYRVGGAFRLSSRWLASLEGVYRPNGVTGVHGGLEWTPVKDLTLRAGYKTDTTKELGPMAGLTFGMGVNVLGQTLAYAWVPLDELGNTHYISFVLRRNKR
jgi:hypothetical protein